MPGRRHSPGFGRREQKNDRGMSGFTLSVAAVADLQEIADHLDAERPSSLEPVLDALERACETVGRYPELGVRRPELGNEARSTVAGHYVIIYRVVELGERPGAEILRIIHERQDVLRAYRSGAVRERWYSEGDVQAINSRFLADQSGVGRRD